MAKLEMIDNGPMYHSPTLDKLAFGSYNKKYDHVRTKLDWLTRDEAVVDAYIARPALRCDGDCRHVPRHDGRPAVHLEDGKSQQDG